MQKGCTVRTGVTVCGRVKLIGAPRARQLSQWRSQRAKEKKHMRPKRVVKVHSKVAEGVHDHVPVRVEAGDPVRGVAFQGDQRKRCDLVSPLPFAVRSFGRLVR